jgi:hypothetical protein
VTVLTIFLLLALNDADSHFLRMHTSTKLRDIGLFAECSSVVLTQSSSASSCHLNSLYSGIHTHELQRAFLVQP